MNTFARAMDDRSPIVAVASSAGDLEAISELLCALPSAFAKAFIIVQRLVSGREGLLAATITQRTSLTVIDATDGIVPERGHVYVLRANALLTIIDGRIRVTPKAGRVYLPGDVLFTSLAEDRGDGAIGVVLSGGGSDGALGTRAIKQCGGRMFAQYPGSARFPSMPISAIETGCVDAVLRPNEIAHEISGVIRRVAPLGSLTRRVPLIDDNSPVPRGDVPARIRINT